MWRLAKFMPISSLRWWRGREKKTEWKTKRENDIENEKKEEMLCYWENLMISAKSFSRHLICLVWCTRSEYKLIINIRDWGHHGIYWQSDWLYAYWVHWACFAAFDFDVYVILCVWLLFFRVGWMQRAMKWSKSSDFCCIVHWFWTFDVCDWLKSMQQKVFQFLAGTKLCVDTTLTWLIHSSEKQQQPDYKFSVWG